MVVPLLARAALAKAAKHAARHAAAKKKTIDDTAAAVLVTIAILTDGAQTVAVFIGLIIPPISIPIGIALSLAAWLCGYIAQAFVLTFMAKDAKIRSGRYAMFKSLGYFGSAAVEIVPAVSTAPLMTPATFGLIAFTRMEDAMGSTEDGASSSNVEGGQSSYRARQEAYFSSMRRNREDERTARQSFYAYSNRTTADTGGGEFATGEGAVARGRQAPAGERRTSVDGVRPWDRIDNAGIAQVFTVGGREVTMGGSKGVVTQNGKRVEPSRTIRTP